ncbi:hypothetical protein [Synoicihabitans lomoniglobus]|nr:hypothetical protein [Opitutaceae bacterium LMO-M01]
MRHYARLVTAVLLTSCLISPSATACTILSAVAPDGQVWTGNNEDGPLDVPLYLNVFPRTDDTRFGYFTFTYDSPRAGIQGGMNEAGLTYDFNALQQPYPLKDPARRNPYPGGDDAILGHLLASASTTGEVVRFFENYWFTEGFERAQMHVADKHGTLAIISPSGSQVFTREETLVTTNFNAITGNNGSRCWRHPVATRLLAESEAGLATITEVCRRTAQNGDGWGTLYSNVQNLTTSEIWIYPGQKFDQPLKTTLSTLITAGRQSYRIQDLATTLPRSE